MEETGGNKEERDEEEQVKRKREEERLVTTSYLSATLASSFPAASFKCARPPCPPCPLLAPLESPDHHHDEGGGVEGGGGRVGGRESVIEAPAMASFGCLCLAGRGGAGRVCVLVHSY